MRRVSIPRLVIAGAIASAAVLGPLGASAPVSADPHSLPATTEFPVPVAVGTACTLAVWVCVPNLTTITPSATTGVPGQTTFSAKVTLRGYSCPDLSVRWLNLSTGATGTTALLRMPVDYSRPVAEDEWCRYTPVTVVTGGGVLAVTADTGTTIAPGDFQILVIPAFGTVQVA
ncbi:hypothetical protein RHDE110596_19880 [Prescottella defluvii]|uniref:hypothetical protein n=1 Tax=Prescottella defluvii TaxID=1323361 RepID=UPI0004F349C7|nr:hypothetical protein [Prescottella defluvii]